MTEEKKMLAGMIYDCQDPHLVEIREKAHDLCHRFNAILPSDEPSRRIVLKELLQDEPEGLFLQGPIQFDYGRFTHFGKNCYANFNLCVLDVCPVTLGDNVFMGPNVSLMTPVHPFLPEERAGYVNANGLRTDKEYAKPITIGSDCWLASNVVVCGGVTIGEGCVIGAGSVVTRDIPPHSLAAGNPCRVIREITPEDSIYQKRELW